MQATRVLDPVNNHPEALRPQLFIIIFSYHRCKKKVPASKRFTVHRTSNVLTLSLKRFANFSGGKITKVSSYICQWHANGPLFCDQPADWWFSVRTLATQSSWTFARSCPRARAIQWCMVSMLSLCTRGTAAMLDTTTATSRWALLNKTHLFILDHFIFCSIFPSKRVFSRKYC